MRYESLGNGSQDNSGDSGWESLSAVPFHEVGREQATDAEKNPLEDSKHYWAPEMYSDYAAPQAQREKIAVSKEELKNYEQVTDAKSRMKVLNFLQWRGMQTRMDDSNPKFRSEFSEIIGSDNPDAMSAESEEALLYDIRDKVYGVNEERFLLEHIASPDKQEGEAAVLNSLSSRHERRFLGEFTKAGFDGYNNLREENIREFMNKYPTPVDFVKDMRLFVGDITSLNGAQKGAEYQVAAESFMNKMYGKRYKYYKQFEELRAEAEALPDTYEKMEQEPPHGVGIATVARGTVRAIRDFIAKNAEGLTNTEFVQRLRSEMLAYRREGIGECQDSVLVNAERRLYGIFDGAGGIEGGQAASRLASRVTNSLAREYLLGDARQLADVLTIAGAKIVSAERNGRQVGATTGVLAQIVDKDDGTRGVAFASAGDSRLYVVHADGSAEQITQDEGHENVISNYLGPSPSRVYDDAGYLQHDTATGVNRNVTQYGEHGLVRGDRIVICSDGITGDRGSDLMSAEELGYYVANSKTPQDAAENLLGFARKLDDRSVVVVDAYPNDSSVVDGFLKKFFGKKR